MHKKGMIFIILALVILGILFVIKINVDFSDTPEFFPLNNPQSSYKITKGCPGGQGWDEKLGNIAVGNYCVEYRGENVFEPTNKKVHFFRITVGTSSQVLQPFLNKEVIVTSGKFWSSDKQCIQQKCTSVGGPLSVLNIYSLKEK